MNGPETLVWWFCFAIAVNKFAVADQDEKDFAKSNETLQFDISRGIKFRLADNETTIVVRMASLLTESHCIRLRRCCDDLEPFLSESEVEQRGEGRLKFKGILSKIGSAMMMAPLLMQIMMLPATLASIKFSLIRSLIVGKLALLMILYNMLKKSQTSEVVVVHKPEYHEHYYHSYHQPEDDDEGLLGR